MLISLLNPQPEDRVRFSYSGLRGAPRESGCYALAVFDGEILYIGQATSIRKRMERHLSEGVKTRLTRWGVAFWLYYKLFPDQDLNNLENGWINEYKIREGRLPFFNKVSPPA